jgi:hypothetical protein
VALLSGTKTLGEVSPKPEAAAEENAESATGEKEEPVTAPAE